jgi:hypothetical protein
VGISLFSVDGLGQSTGTTQPPDGGFDIIKFFEGLLGIQPAGTRVTQSATEQGPVTLEK